MNFRRVAFLLLLLTIAGCREQPKPPEKTYPLIGTIVGRDVRTGSLLIEHQDVPGLMQGMTMEFPVRGANLDDLPPNGSPITAKLHVTETTFWITDVKRR